MKNRNGFVANSSTSNFILKTHYTNPEDIENRLKLFIQCGMLCGFVDDLWKNKVWDIDVYNYDGETHIRADELPLELEKFIKFFLEVKEEIPY